MNGKRWAALGIAAVLLFFSVAINTMTTFISKDFQKAMEDFMNPTNGFMAEEIIEEGNMMKRIAVLDLNGTIQAQAKHHRCLRRQATTTEHL